QQACSRQPQTFSRFAAFAPRGALHGAVLTIHSCDLTRSAVPVLLVPTVGLTLSLPQRIGTRCDLLVFLPIHGNSPSFPKLRLTLPWGCRQTALAWSRGQRVSWHASARRRTNRLLRDRCGLPHGERAPIVMSRLLQRRVLVSQMVKNGEGVVG